MLGFSRRGVLDQLEQLVAPHDLPRGGGHVLAHDELSVVGLADAKGAAAALQIRREVLHSLDQGLAAGFGQSFQGDGVGRQEVGWREGVGQQPGEELRPALHRRIDVLDARDQAVHPVRRQQIGPPHHVEHRIFRPGRVLEAFVGRCGRRGLSGRLTGRGGPQLHIAAEQIGLGLEHLFPGERPGWS